MAGFDWFARAAYLHIYVNTQLVQTNQSQGISYMRPSCRRRCRTQH